MKKQVDGNRGYKEDDLAIIGMAGRFPEADDVEEFWNNLKNGRDSIRELPESRIHELRNMLGDLPQIKYARGGYLDQISYFEPEIFNLSREECKFIDPQQRLLLELVEEAILDAGYNPEDLLGQRIGVFVAQNENNYTKHFVAISPMAFQNSNAAVGAGRIAYTYNFTGPAVTIGTACSSSLVALNNASHCLKNGEAEMAIVGGVKLNLMPGDESTIGSTPILSISQKVKTFDKNADGTVGGEGGGVLFIKSLLKALDDGDNVHAIVKSCAVNSDGNRSNGMSSPSEEGQAEVILQAIELAKIEPCSISYIETHGTGTKIGDPIEVAGISQALEKLGYPRHSVGLSAVKSNIGHLDGAAGVAGVIKTVLSLKYQKLVQTVHFTSPNPLLDFLNSPVYVNDRLSDWSDDVRRAGVTSLGITGTNAHVILEEAPVIEDTEPDRKNIIILSARTETSLESMVNRLKEHLQQHPDVSITNIAYTLNNGRRDLKYKFVTVVRSTQELIHKLSSFNSANQHEEMSEYLYYTQRVKDKHKQKTTTALLIPDIKNIVIEGLEKQLIQEWGFARYLREFAEQAGNQCDLNDPRFRYAMIVYAWIQGLHDYGVKPKVILGFGIGSIVANLASKQISFEEAILQLNNYTLKDLQIPEAKLSVFLDQIFQRDVNTLILFSPEEALASLFTTVMATKENASLMIQSAGESSLSTVIKLMQQGMAISWETLYESRKVRRVSLPGYAFDRQSYYLPLSDQISVLESQMQETAVTQEEPDLELLHQLHWVEEPLAEKENDVSGTWVIFSDQVGLASQITEQLQARNGKVIYIRSGDQFHKVDEEQYLINITEQVHYDQLVRQILETEERVEGVINLLNFEEPQNLLQVMEQNEMNLYYSSLYLFQAFFKQQKQLRLYHITTNAHRVLGEDALINPEKRMIWTLNKVINQEIDGYQSYCIDFDLSQSSLQEISQQVIQEILAGGSILEIAYRHQTRYVQYLRSVEPKHSLPMMIKTGGVYLLTGGTGGIGLEIARYLATWKVTLVLLNRTSLDLDSSSGQSKWKIIEEIKKTGSQVELIQCDIADHQQVKEVIRSIKATHGQIDGVIHTAGLPGGRPQILNITREDAETVFAAKVYGTMILAEELQDQFLDFFVSCSSLSSQVGGVGFGIYATANSFLDSFSALQRQLGRKYIAINWGNWGETGMSARHQKQGYSSGISNLTNADGINAFATIITQNLDGCAVNRLTEKVSQLYASFSFFRVQGNANQVEKTYRDKDQLIEDNLYAMLNDVYVGDDLELTDRVLDLELDSIDVMQFVGKVKKTYNVTIPMNLFFAEMTVGDVLSQIKALITGTPVEGGVISRQPDQEYYPMSSSQKRLYLVTQLDEDSISYNLNSFWFIEGELDTMRVQHVMEQLIQHHEALRTSFDVINGEFMQQVHSEVEFAVNYFEAKEEEVETLCKDFIKPFDLRKAPLIRIGIAKLEKRNLLMMDLHHIIFDGVSQNLLFKEFFALYQGEQLPELTLQYRDFAVWQHNLLHSEQIFSQKKIWEEQFAGKLPVLTLPTDYQRPQVLDFKGANIKFSMTPELTGKLNQLAKAKGVTIYMLLLAAYNILIGKYANQEDIIVGSPITGRHHSDLEQIIGLFVNTLPLRNYPVKAKQFSAFLAEVKENTLKAFENQDYPLEKVIEDLSLVHDPGRNPLFDIEFNLNSQSREHLFSNIEIGQLTFIPYLRDLSVARFDLSLTGVESGGKLQMEMQYRKSLFTQNTIQSMIENFIKILETIVLNPDIRVQDIQLVELQALEGGDFAQTEFDF